MAANKRKATWPKFEKIFIFEIKFEKKNILFTNGGQNKFWDRPIAQYIGRYQIFFTKRCVTDS